MLQSRLFQSALPALAALLCISLASAQEPAKIDGSYVQDRPCEGSLEELKPSIVTIRADTIVYADGSCQISNRRQEGTKLLMRATCKDDTGTVLAGDLTITITGADTIEMEDATGVYAAVLHRCPEGKVPSP